MTWSRLETTRLAKPGCQLCKGEGIIQGARITTVNPCGCVLREIFRQCLDHFRTCAASVGSMRAARWACEGGRSKNRGICHVHRNQEFVADFCLSARRELSGLRLQIFNFHFVLGGAPKLVCRRLGISLGEYFHQQYRIEEILGRAFREMQPYALYPLKAYFGDVFAHCTESCLVPPMVRPLPLRPPLRALAQQPACIVADDHRGNCAAVRPADFKDPDAAHLGAAVALCRRMNWTVSCRSCRRSSLRSSLIVSAIPRPISGHMPAQMCT